MGCPPNSALGLSALVEEVIVCAVRHQGLFTCVGGSQAATGGCGTARGIEPLDEGGLRQKFAAHRPRVRADHLQEHTRDGAGVRATRV